MRRLLFLLLLLLLTACTAFPLPTGKTGGPVDPLAAPEASSNAPKVPEPLAASVLLAVWNEPERRHEIRPVDPTTGEPVPGYPPLLLAESYERALSPDGSRLAAIAYQGTNCDEYAGGTRCRPGDGVLHLLDIAAWREVTATLPVQGSSWPLVFSPDASRLALVTTEPAGTHLLLVDGTNGELLARRSVPFSPSLMEFTPDGTSLVLYGTPEGSQPGMTQPEPPGVLLLDAANLDLVWEHTLDGVLSGFWCIEDCDAPHGEQLFAMWSPAVVLSADHGTLYVVHADDDTLTTVDFAARSVSSVRIHVARSWLDTLMGLFAGVAEAKAPIDGASKVGALAPDGHTLYVVGHAMQSERSEQGGWQMSQESFGLQSIDVQTGQRVSSIPAEASNLRMSPDGQFLFLEGEGEPGASTQILDARTLEPLARLARWEPLLGQRLGGDPILLAVRYGETTTELAVLDIETFEVIDTWRPDGHAIWLVPH